jgi:DNA polymerase
LSAENRRENADREPEQPALPDRASVLALAAEIRACLRLHHQMGIERYPQSPGLRGFLAVKPVRRGMARRLPPPVAPPPQVSAPAQSAEPVIVPRSSDQLEFLERDLSACRLCPLAAERQGLVTGLGGAGARLMIVGGFSRQTGGFAPTTLFGEAEDAMLWNMVRAMGLSAADVYVTNAVKCCPPGGQSPSLESVQACQGHLRREIELVRPQAMLAMGEAAACSALGSDTPVSRLRGRWRRTAFADASGGNLEVMVTFHPSYLLAQPDMKKAVWADLQTIQRRLATPEAGASKKKP